jgi:hypothetical protein
MITHFQKVETIQEELSDMGYVFPTALRWTSDDIDLALERAQLSVDWDRQTKFELLKEFFEQNEGCIVQFINSKLNDFVEDKHEI